MQNKYLQNFIQLFINNQLKLHKLNNSIIIDKIDDIIHEIQSHSKFNHLSDVQIFQQLIVETSYNSFDICCNLLSIYLEKYYKQNNKLNTFNIWTVFKNLFIVVRDKKTCIASIEYAYLIYAGNLYDLENVRWRKDKLQLSISKEDFQNMKYSFLRSTNNENDIEEFKIKIKSIFVYVHKFYKTLNQYNQCAMSVPEDLFFLFKSYVVDFNFSFKDYKMLVNILVVIVIINFQALKDDKYPYFQNRYSRGWIGFIDIIFSNWHLLCQKYKIFLKENGKDIILVFSKYHALKEYQQAQRDIFFNLIDKLPLT